jgi:hypothetical protein
MGMNSAEIETYDGDETPDFHFWSHIGRDFGGGKSEVVKKEEGFERRKNCKVQGKRVNI